MQAADLLKSTASQTAASDIVAGDAALARLQQRLTQEQQAESGTPNPDPRLRELFARVTTDRRIRNAANDLPLRRDWAAGLNDNAQLYAMIIATGRMCDVDRENTAWLKADIAAHGWYLVSKQGQPAAGSAWLLVQHADLDPTFQAQVLDLIEPLVAKGEARAADVALLHDRVAHNAAKPQRFGTQGRCTAPHTWTPWETEEPATLDHRRAEAGLPAMSDYLAMMGKVCP